MGGMPAEQPLLATKLFVPEPRPNRVRRERLRGRLEAARGGTVTLVAAPAGSGKSTLLADWAHAAGRRVAWLSLDAGDDEPRRFLGYVIAALKGAGALPAAVPVPLVPAPELLEATLDAIVNALAPDGEPAAFVLDDYHLIRSEAVHALVQRLVDHLPPNLHLVLASRVDPPLALARLRARDQLVEIRAADLRFTDEEATSFFNEAMGLGLTPAQVTELDRRTEGWAVGLQMAAISLRGGAVASAFIASFGGSNRYVLDYLTEEVLRGQPAEVRDFLLSTAILQRLSAPLCDAVTGRGDAARLLERLDAANLFLIPLDHERYWYRYHHLFGSLLQHEAERTLAKEEIAESHRRASAWYETEGMPEPALHHAVSGGDEERAVAIVGRHARPHILAGDGGTIVRWLSQLPPARVGSDFDLAMLRAMAHSTEYRMDEAGRALECAERLVGETDRERRMGAILGLRGMVERMQGERARSVATLQRAMELSPPDDLWYAMSAFHLGITAFTAPDQAELRRAEEYFDQATASRRLPDGLLPAVLGRCYGGWSRLVRGLAGEALAAADEAETWIDEWAREHGTGRPLASLVYALRGDVYRLRNELPEARAAATRAMEMGRTGFFVGTVEGGRVLAQVEVARGAWDASFAAVREMASVAKCGGNVELLGAVTAMEKRILWRRGAVTGSRADKDAVARWCEETGLFDVEHRGERRIPDITPEFGYLTAIRVLIDAARHEEARCLASALLTHATREERVPSQLGLLVLLALAEAGLGRLEPATAAMERALDIASGPGFVRPFLDEGAAVVPLLEKTRPADRAFAARVLAAFEVPRAPRAAAPEDDALSDRELEVLRLVASGASNQAAAKKLFVAPSTVKKHLENIYAKLGVGGRLEAVARARERRIL